MREGPPKLFHLARHVTSQPGVKAIINYVKLYLSNRCLRVKNRRTGEYITDGLKETIEGLWPTEPLRHYHR
jgi:hypothetical protein